MKRFAHYHLIRRLARGGIGDVWLAQQEDASPIAIKTLLPRWRDCAPVVERFLHQGTIACTLHHPNIVQGYHVDQHDNIPYISMEYVDGWTLRMLMRRMRVARASLAPHIAAFIAVQILQALHAAHTVNILHADLSPSNVLLSRRGEVKLTDFQGVFEMCDHIVLAREHHLGQHAYAPPDHIEPYQAKDACMDDVYGVGVMLYEMLTGRRPTPPSLSAPHGKDTEPRWAHALLAHDGMTEVLHAALHPDRTQRFANATALQHAITMAQADDTVCAQQELIALCRQHDRPLYPSGIRLDDDDAL